MQFGQILQQAIAAKAVAQTPRLGTARLLRLVPRKSDDDEGGA